MNFDICRDVCNIIPVDMLSHDTHLSVIVPVYNAEPFIVQSLNALDEFFSVLAYRVELIIVDDESRDRSLEIATEWAKKPRPYGVKVIPHPKNLGKGGAVATGMLAATGKFRVFIDVDLAYPPSQILRIVEALEDGNDVSVACRVDPDSRYTISPAFLRYIYTRHLSSRIINWFMRHTIIPHCRDSQAGLKGFTAEAAEIIFSRQTIFGFSFDVEALFMAEKMGYSIREVAVEFRYFNEPTTVAFLRDGLNLVSDIFKVRLNHFLGKYKLPQKNDGKFLIINADDFGMTLEISKGILKTNAAGLVKSTTVMVNSSDFESSMDEIFKNHAKLDVGLHVTLTWGRPVSDPKTVPTLTDKNGNFLSRNKLLKKAITGKISYEEVYKEIHAQCEKLVKRVPEITHIDGHHHIHIFPIVRRAIEKVAREFGIRVVRTPYEGRWSPWNQAFGRRFVIALLSASRPAYWRGRGFFSPDNFGGFMLGGWNKKLKKQWLNTIDKLPRGITEIMVHPGYFSDNKDSYNKQRETEISMLTDKDVLSAINSAGIKVISFKEMI